MIHVHRPEVRVAALNPTDANAAPVWGTGFAQNAVYNATAPPLFEGDVKLYGSWLGSHVSIGVAHSTWYPPVSRFYMFVAGYPNHPGNELVLEVRTANFGTVILPISPGQDPAESWRLKGISLQSVKQPVAFRISAIDESASYQGWLGFSQPFFVKHIDYLELSKELLFTMLATAAGIVIFVSPGLLIRQKLNEFCGRNVSFIWIPAPGIAMLALLGLIVWIGSRWLAPAITSRIGLAILVLYITYRFVRVPISRITNAIERHVLLIVIVLAAIAVSKAMYSIGPAGELYGGYISRSLAVGERSDSRMPYIVVQLVGLRKGPYSEFSNALHGGWNFSSRGPIAGLAVTPIVLASSAQPPEALPEQPWTVFDPEGFSTYRIAMMVLTAASLITIFGLAKLFLPDEWAFFAFLIATTAPFTIHDIFFTWPKLIAASFVLLAAYLAFQSRYLLSGLVLGFGYLCHPSAVMWFPSLLALAVLSPASGRETIAEYQSKTYLWSIRALSLTTGVALWFMFWKLINGKHYAQGLFFTYFSMAGGWPITISNWLASRFNSLCNTLIPLNLFLFHRTEPGLHSIYGWSPDVIPFFFQYWNTLPFGIGIVFFFGFARLIYLAFRKTRAWLVLVFVIPFLFFTIYLGWPSKGLLKEGLQVWFFGLIIFAVVMWKKYLAGSEQFWRFCKWALLVRGPETALMLLLPSIWSQHMFVQRQFALTDVVAITGMLAATTWLYIFTFERAERLRLQGIPEQERLDTAQSATTNT